MRPKRYPYRSLKVKTFNLKSKEVLTGIEDFPEYVGLRYANQYEGHREDFIQNVKLSHQLANEILKYRLDVIKDADTKNPEMVKAIAALMQDARTTVTVV